jgi:hypothetical protein
MIDLQRDLTLFINLLCVSKFKIPNTFLDGERERERERERMDWRFIARSICKMSGCHVSYNLLLKVPKHGFDSGGGLFVEMMLHQFLGFFSVFLRVVGKEQGTKLVLFFLTSIAAAAAAAERSFTSWFGLIPSFMKQSPIVY